jgi:hypothetical protein
MGVLSSTCTTSGAFTPDSVVERHSSGAAQLHSNRRIFSTSLGDPTVPASFTRQLPRNQEFAMIRLHGSAGFHESIAAALFAVTVALICVRRHDPGRN